MNKTVELLGDKAEYLLSHTCKTIDKRFKKYTNSDSISEN